MLAVGRLHPVKDHRFLVRACAELKTRRVPFMCLIAGDGPERPALDRLIRELGLNDEVKLLGHLERRHLDRHYALADLVVLTSRSEGIPLVLMEAMLHGKTVLAPAITGIPELVMDRKTGFLYQTGSIDDFVAHVQLISRSQSVLLPVRQAAREHVLRNFNRETNLSAFADFFVDRVGGSAGKPVAYEDRVLQ